MSFMMNFAAAALLVGSGTALACGDDVATRGGQMNDDGGETAVELVQQDGEVLLYLADHGMDISTAGATGTLRFDRANRSIAETLFPGGGNLLKARLQRPLRVGDKVTAQIGLRNGDTAVVTFVYGMGIDVRKLPLRQASIR